jgi:hypothetical protein
MRWAYSKSEEREQSVRMVWQAKGSGSRHEPTPSSPHRILLRTLRPAWGTTRGPRCFRGLRSPSLPPSHLARVPTNPTGPRPLSRTRTLVHQEASAMDSVRPRTSPRQLHVSGTPPLPATSEGYPTPTHHYVPQPEVSHTYFDQFTYPHPPTGKGSPFEPDASPTVYYSQDFNNPTVTNFFPDSSLPPIPGASASYPTTQFYYSGN